MSLSRHASWHVVPLLYFVVSAGSKQNPSSAQFQNSSQTITCQARPFLIINAGHHSSSPLAGVLTLLPYARLKVGYSPEPWISLARSCAISPCADKIWHYVQDSNTLPIQLHIHLHVEFLMRLRYGALKIDAYQVYNRDRQQWRWTFLLALEGL